MSRAEFEKQRVNTTEYAVNILGSCRKATSMLIICTKETVRRFFKKYLEKIVNISEESGTKKVFLFDSCAK